jgi:hypothetical protein
MLDEAFTKRVRALALRIGVHRLRDLLGVSNATFAAARDRGRMKLETRDRIVTALDRIEKEHPAP